MHNIGPGLHASTPAEFPARQKTVAGDLVCILPDLAGEVASCVDDNGELFVIVKLLVWVGAVTVHSRRWRKSEELALWHAVSITTPSAWYARDDDWVAVM